MTRKMSAGYSWRDRRKNGGQTRNWVFCETTSSPVTSQHQMTRYRDDGGRIRLDGPIEVWKRKGRSRRGRDKLGESGNGSIHNDPSTHSRP